MKNLIRPIIPILTIILMVTCTTRSPNATALPKHQFMRVAQQQAAYEIDTLLNHAPTEMGWWGVKVQYATTGEVVYERKKCQQNVYACFQ